MKIKEIKIDGHLQIYWEDDLPPVLCVCAGIQKLIQDAVDNESIQQVFKDYENGEPIEIFIRKKQ